MNVLVVEDHPMFRDGLAAMLGDRSDVTEVRTAGSGRAALECCAGWSPDVAVVDLGVPDGDGFWVTRELRRTCPGVHVLVLTSADDERSVIDALHAGAHGYILKTVLPEDIAEAVATVRRGMAVVSDEVFTVMVRRLTAPAGSRQQRPFAQLTDREHEILEGLAQGLGTDAIASSLGLSPKTVRNHISNVLVKIGVADRSAAVALARDRGLGQRPRSSGSTAD